MKNSAISRRKEGNVKQKEGRNVVEPRKKRKVVQPRLKRRNVKKSEVTYER